MNDISCKNVKVTYILKNKQYVDGLDGLSIDFLGNRINVLFGENGCGKTTLFNCLVGLLPYDGEIYFDDIEASQLLIRERHISYVQQNLSLFPKLTIFDNLAYPLKNQKLSPEEITKRIYDILNLLEIPHLMNCIPSQISIGQLQKVCLAKALITNPKILILDEAFSNLDPKIISAIKIAIKSYVLKSGANVIYVTHNIDDALNFGDYFYIINNHEVLYETNKKDVNKTKLEEMLIKR